MSVVDRDTLPTTCFSVQAVCEPSVMSRVLELFVKRGLTPTRMIADVSGPDSATLTIDIQMRGLEPALAGYMALCQPQPASVNCLLVSARGVVPSGRNTEGP